MDLLAKFRTSASQLPFSARETLAYTREHFARAGNVVNVPVEAVVEKLLIEPLNIAASLFEHFGDAVKQMPEIARVFIKGETYTPKEFLTTEEEITAYLDQLDARDLAHEICELNFEKIPLLPQEKLHHYAGILATLRSEISDPDLMTPDEWDLLSEQDQEKYRQNNRILYALRILQWSGDFVGPHQPYTPTPIDKHSFQYWDYIDHHKMVDTTDLHRVRGETETPLGVKWDIPSDIAGTKHVQRIQTAYERLPEYIKTMCHELGLTIKIPNKTIDIEPEAETMETRGGRDDRMLSMVGGFAQPWNTTIVMPREEQGYNKAYNINTEVEWTLYHEIGHIVDTYLAGKHGKISWNNDALKGAYEKDVLWIGLKKSADKNSYFLSKENGGTHDNDLNGRDEAFAELFASEMIRRSGYSMLGRSDIGAHFPRMKYQMTRVIDAIQHEYALFPTAGMDAFLAKGVPEITIPQTTDEQLLRGRLALTPSYKPSNFKL